MSVHHKEATEPYVVPFESDHPRHIFQNIVQGALLRAFRYSTTLEEFNRERRYIKLMLLYNGYPTTYVHVHFHKFLRNYSFDSTCIAPIVLDDNEYMMLRHQILPQPTIPELARASRIASQLDYKVADQTSEPLLKTKLMRRQQRDYSLSPFIIHYTHEERFAYYKSMIHPIWNETFKSTPIITNRLIVGTRNQKNLQKELLRRSPPQSENQNNENKAINLSTNQRSAT
ncbi:unnamed protein product [Rotaria socialis]|uniref:Helix-turn-helix domain-containing protein n=1 Tax=Rotaria socialis TaxID=392032 RepID=A0A818Z6Y9_9BILA|nr:unnamed protein product [Rotaria socialis]CAF4961238.1 unnamed protein product [Rotaria socialis]